MGTVGALAGVAEAECDVSTADGAAALASATKKFEEYCRSKVNIEYEPKKTLKVGGHDIHLLVNAWISSWKAEPAMAADVGRDLGKLFIIFADSTSSEKEEL